MTLDHPSPTEVRQFAGAIAISGNRVLVGSRLDDVGSVSAGAVHLYDLSSGTPNVATLSIDNPDPRSGAQFGYALDLDGQQAVVGVWLDTPDVIPTAGSTYVFDLDGVTPTEPTVTLQKPMPQPVEEFGYTVAIAGNTVLASTRFNNVGKDYAYVYDMANATPEVSIGTLENVTPAAQDRFGFAVSVDGNLMAVGTPLEDDASVDGGAVYVYDLSSGTPVFLTRLFSPTPSGSDAFGISVSVSGTRIAVGSFRDDVGAINAGSVFVYDMSSTTPDLPVVTVQNPTPEQGDEFGACSILMVTIWSSVPTSTTQ